MRFAASFVIGFPYEELGDIEKTLRVMSIVNYEARGRCDLQLHLLSPVPGAPLATEAGVNIDLDQTMSDLSAASNVDAVMRRWIGQHGRPVFDSFYHYVNTSIPRRRIVCAQRGWFEVFSHLQLTALALEKSRQTDDFALFSIFDDREAPGHSEDPTAEFEWCVNSICTFLTRFVRPWAASVRSVLTFEAEIHRLRIFGGSPVITTSHEVLEWAENINSRDLPLGFPRPVESRYLVIGHGERIKIARLRTHASDARSGSALVTSSAS